MQTSGLKVAVKLPDRFKVAQKGVDMAAFRSELFEKTLKTHIQAKGYAWNHGTGQGWLADILADAFHWCDVNGCDADFVLKMARSHHESEKLEDVMRITANRPFQPISPMNQTAPH